MEQSVLQHAANDLTKYYVQNHPLEVARMVETLEPHEAAKAVQNLVPETLAHLLKTMTPGTANLLVECLSDKAVVSVVAKMSVPRCAMILQRLPNDRQQALLALLPKDFGHEVKELMSYPPESAGSLMDTHILAFNHQITVAQAFQQLKRSNIKTLSKLFLLNDENRLVGQIDLYRFTLADKSTLLSDLAMPVQGVVNVLDSKESVSDSLTQYKVKSVPVIDSHQRLIGVIHSDALVETLQENLVSDMQTMVGASKDEWALSPSLFAVRKRLLWLNINLLTVFLAAAVVGLFVNIIAKFAVLAVLLPVVAGQSGNAGAQALAVTMRSLALREISTLDWLAVVLKEFKTGFIAGAILATICGAGVYLWNGSMGLSMVIIVAMLFSMVVACMAGAVVPILLKKFGQDPAASSAIVLTTITDVAGLFSFLGLATLMADKL